MALTTRALDAADVSACARLEAAVFPHEAWSPQLLLEELTSRWGHYLGIWDGEDLVAYGGVKGDIEGDLMTVAVLPAYRRQGVGERLVRKLLTNAAQAGIETVFLEVRESNASARRLYERVGFTIVGHLPCYYRAPVEDAVLMAVTMPGFPKTVVA